MDFTLFSYSIMQNIKRYGLVINFKKSLSQSELEFFNVNLKLSFSNIYHYLNDLRKIIQKYTL